MCGKCHGVETHSAVEQYEGRMAPLNLSLRDYIGKIPYESSKGSHLGNYGHRH